MGALSPWHWAILAVVVILLFGAKRLPDSARSLGKSMRIFRAEVKELHADDHPPSGPGDESGHLEAPAAPHNPASSGSRQPTAQPAP